MARIKNKPLKVFLIVLVIAYVVQGKLWTNLEPLDKSIWANRTAAFTTLITGQETNLDVNDVTKFGGHPGMIPVALASAFQLISRQSAPTALISALITLNAISIALIALLAYQLRPHSPWWVAAALIALLHPLYYFATPTSAVFAPLIAVLYLNGFMLSQQGKQARHERLIPQGVVLGLAVATRLTPALLLSAPLIVWLAVRLKPRATLMVVVTSLVTFVILDPLLWLKPKEHIAFLLWHSAVVPFTKTNANNLTITDFAATSALTIIPFFLTVILLVASFISNRSSLLPLPRSQLILLLATTVIATIVYASAQVQSLRYFFPISFLWDLLLPLLLLHLFSQTKLSTVVSPRHATLLHGTMQGAIIIIIVAGHITMWAYRFLTNVPQAMI